MPVTKSTEDWGGGWGVGGGGGGGVWVGGGGGVLSLTLRTYVRTHLYRQVHY